MEKYTYEIPVNPTGEEAKMIVRSDGLWIPIDESNSDYQAYLNKDTLASELSNPSTPQAGE